MTTRSTIPALMLAASGLASSAQAQCDWFILDVPDFDQRRIASGGIDGLPGNGGMYCVPTAFTNWFAYLANRGLPQANSLDGPRDWQSNANYDRVTDVLQLMGTLMETDPSKGTKGKAVSGASLYAALTMSGDVVITGQSIWGGGSPPAPTPQMLYDLHKFGAYTAGTYGFYTGTGGGQRTGGHAITFNGVWGCTGSPILQFRDPADEAANTTQADFRTAMAALTPVNGTFISSSGGSQRTMTLYRMDVTSASTNFLDAVYVIMPMAALFGGGGLDAGELRLVRPFLPQGNPGVASAPFNKPAGTGAVLDVVMSLDPAIHYYITGQGTSQPPTVWRLNILTGQSTAIIVPGTAGGNPARLAFGRLGDLYVLDGVRGSIARYNPATTPATPINGFTPSIDPDAIAYDDKTDRIVILTKAPTIGSRRLLVYPYTLTGFGTDRAVPATYNGNAFVQPDAETNDAFFICSEGSGVLRRFIGQGGDLVETDSILHLNGSLTALNVTDANRLIYANNGTLLEKEENSLGNWVNRANSRWAGREATGAVSIARSRTNHLASVMEGPSFDNLANPTIYPRLPACYANCDDSTVPPILNINDFVCFQMKFAQGHPYANCDNSTSPPILNVSDFTCFQTRYAQGCP